jgi:hypothetical protein
MQILTVNNNYRIFVSDTGSDSNYIRCVYSYRRTEYPDLNDYLIKHHLKPINFVLSGESFEGVIEQYSYAMPPIFGEGFKGTGEEPAHINKDIYGVDDEEVRAMQIDLQEFLDTAVYGHLTIKKADKSLN